MKRDSIVTLILQRLLGGEKMASIDTEYANSNQYYGQIKKQGIELIEVWFPNKTNSGRHKERWLNPTIENIQKVKDLLKLLKA